MQVPSRLALVTFGLIGLAVPAGAADWYVAVGGTGSGSQASPFGRVQDGINAAQPGDVVLVGPGTFNETIQSVRAGSASQPISVRAIGDRGSTIVTASGRVLTVSHGYFTIEGLVLDGQYGANDLVRLTSAANGFVLKNTEVRHAGNDAIDMGSVQDVLIENSLIHHALNPTNGRTDAHGITGAAVQRLTIRNTEIHTFSGDGIQVDPGRSAPGWTDVTIDGCRIWLAPLPQAENGFPAATVTGENAVDTKASTSFPRSRITIRNTDAYGFKWPTTGSNIAAFNLKEHIDATVDGVTVHDSEIAFRLRGSTGWIRVQNAVVYSVDVGFRYEDSIQNLRIWNTTLGSGVTQPFLAASASASGLDVRNLLLLGASLPVEASHPSNRALPATAFVNAASHDYELAPGSPAIDAGVTIAEVSTDRLSRTRPQGTAYDIGAYERVPGAGTTLPRAPTNLRIIR